MICRTRVQDVWQPQGGEGTLDYRGWRPRPREPYIHEGKVWYTEAAEPKEWEKEARAFHQAGLLSQHGFQ